MQNSVHSKHKFIFLLLLVLLLSISLHSSPVNADTNNIQTIAGIPGWMGYAGDGGPATLALLNNPEGITVDSNGNIYIADTDNALIRKIDIDTGVIDIVAGTRDSTASTNDGGLATNTYLYEVEAVALDSAGNIYIVNKGLPVIRKVDAATGIISTVAGKLGIFGQTGDGGPAIDALLADPSDIEIDMSGNIYFTDRANHVLRKVDGTTGIISTVAGNIGIPGATGDGGLATDARLTGPENIVIDSSGNIYIADSGNQVIRKINSSDGIINTIAGTIGTQGNSGDGGFATDATLGPYVSGIAIDPAGNIYISDTGNEVIRAIDSSTGIINTVAGVKHYIKNYHAPDYFGNGGPAIGAVFGRESPKSIVFDLDGNLLIADSENHAIRKIQTGSVITHAGTVGTPGYTGDGGLATNATLREPKGIVVDSSGNVFIAVGSGDRGYIRKVDYATGIISTIAGNIDATLMGSGGLATDARLIGPTGIAVDSSGNIYIAEPEGDVIRKINVSTGIIDIVAGTPGARGYTVGDGILATSAVLNFPSDVAVDSAGNVYIADSDNARIRKVDAITGIISTIAGTGDWGYSGDGGLAINATLYSPKGIALDSSGNVYIADRVSHVIRKVDSATGIISTIAGNGSGLGPFGDGGLATAAGLLYPEGVAVDSKGDIYIADTENNAVRKIDANTGIIKTVVGIIQAPNGSWEDPGTVSPGLLHFPSDIDVDSDGNIFIADTINQAVAKASSYSVASPPNNVQATADDASATISWTPPTSDGGSTILYYGVISNPHNIYISSTSTSASLLGLENGTAYTFTVTATNSFATGISSSSSNSIVPSTNVAPISAVVAVTTYTNISATVPLSGYDEDENNLTFEIVSPPSNGTLYNIATVNEFNATVVYSPSTEFSGIDNFTYKVNDGRQDSPITNVTITVNPISIGTPTPIPTPIIESGPTAIEAPGMNILGTILTAILMGIIILIVFQNIANKIQNS